MGKYIYYEESPYNKGKYTLRLNHEEFPFPTGTSGSYNVMLARIAGLDFPSFLRMCRDIGGAEIIGKNTLYPVAYFKFGEGLITVQTWLNKRAEYILNRHNHPYEFILDEGGRPVGKIWDDGAEEKI